MLKLLMQGHLLVLSRCRRSRRSVWGPSAESLSVSACLSVRQGQIC